MKLLNKKLLKLFAFVIFTGALAATVGCKEKQQETTHTTEKTSKTEETVTVTMSAAAIRNAGIEVAPVMLETMSDNITAPARIIPSQAGVAHVGSFIPGRVTKLLVQEGSSVAKNQVLAELASYDLSELVSEYLKARTDVLRTEKILSRQSKLSNDKLLSQQELEEAQSNHSQAVDRQYAAQTKLHTLGLDPDKLAEDKADGLRSTIALRSPIAGVVSKRLVKIGDYVQPDSNLFEVVDLNTVWADAQVPPQVASDLVTGSSGSVESTGGIQRNGKIIFISPVADPETHTVTVRLEVNNVSRDLKPETFVTARFKSRNSKGMGMTVPLQALEKDGEEYFVYKQVSDTTFQRLVVIVQSKNEHQATVTASEISEGDKIAIVGVFYLKSELKRDELQDND